jgi:hypothetical protein
VRTEAVEAAIARIEGKLLALGERELASEKLGEMVMLELKKLDKVAYVRFASVYRNFEDVDEFSKLIREVSRGRRRKSVALMSPGFTAADHEMMARALRLAERGLIPPLRIRASAVSSSRWPDCR